MMIFSKKILFLVCLFSSNAMFAQTSNTTPAAPTVVPPSAALPAPPASAPTPAVSAEKASPPLAPTTPPSQAVPPPPSQPTTSTTPTATPTSAVPPTAKTTEPAGFYYYCQSAQVYYPTTLTCNEGWVAIPVGSPPPISRHHRDFSPWQDVETPETRALLKSHPNAVTLEFMGRAVAYSLDYDRAVSDQLTLGLGISSWEESWRWADYHSTVTVVPLYGNYYLSQKPSRGYFSAGLDLIEVSRTAGNNNSFMNNGVAVTAGAGYETRDPSGFLLRLGIYLIAGRSVILSPSVSFGFAF